MRHRDADGVTNDHVASADVVAAENGVAPRELDAAARLAIATATGAPEFLLPWLDRFYTPADAGLVLAAAGAGNATDRAAGLGALAPQALERAVRRAVLDRADDGLFTPSSFHARFEMWAFFEGWCDLPDDVRRRLNEWELADYIGKIGPGVEAMRDGRAAESDQRSFTPSCCSTRRRRCCVPSRMFTCGPATAVPCGATAPSRSTSACASATTVTWAGS